MNVLIVEDERPAADKLKQLLKNIDPAIKVIDTIETVEGTVNWLREYTSPDLILMDIQLNDGTCFEIFSVVNITTPVIFTTAYDEYAIRAFKVNSIDYLLKPIDQESLESAITKFKTFYKNNPVDNDKINHIYEGLIKNYRTRFLVKIGLHYTSIVTNNIECFYICERSAFLKTFTGKTYDIDYSLEQIQSMIDPGIFFRINRNYIININSITSILSYSTNRLKINLTGNYEYDELIVSRDKVSEFKNWLNK